MFSAGHVEYGGRWKARTQDLADLNHKVQDQIFMNCQNERIHDYDNWRDHSIGIRLLGSD